MIRRSKAAASVVVRALIGLCVVMVAALVLLDRALQEQPDADETD